MCREQRAGSVDAPSSTASGPVAVSEPLPDAGQPLEACLVAEDGVSTQTLVQALNALMAPGLPLSQLAMPEVESCAEKGELVLAEDAPPAPNYMADKTPLKRLGVMSTRDLRNEYYRDPAHRGYLSYMVKEGESPSLFFKKPGEAKDRGQQVQAGPGRAAQ